MRIDSDEGTRRIKKRIVSLNPVFKAQPAFGPPAAWIRIARRPEINLTALDISPKWNRLMSVSRELICKGF
jgi:hypothetical protein